jgi:hypothetical protein
MEALGGAPIGMELLTNRDPEDVRQLLDPVLERVMVACRSWRGGCIRGRRCRRGASGTPLQPPPCAELAVGPTAC